MSVKARVSSPVLLVVAARCDDFLFECLLLLGPLWRGVCIMNTALLEQ